MPLSFDIDETEIDTPALVPAVTKEIVQPISPPSGLSFPPGCDPHDGDPVYLDIETVPDDKSPRAKFFPVQTIPPEVAIEKMMAVEKFIALSVEKQKEYLEPITPPQAWISQAIAAELTRDDKKTRDGTIKLLNGKRSEAEDYIKALSVDPLTLKIVSIGIGIGECPVRVLTLEQFPRDVVQGIPVEPEAAMLAEAGKIISDKRYTPIVGFGVIRFDLRAMLIRSAILGVVVPRMFDLRKFGSSDVIDLEVAIYGGQVPRGHGMKPTAQMLGIDVPESHGDGSKVYQLYKDGNWAAIANYNRGDIEILRAIHERVAGKFCQ